VFFSKFKPSNVKQLGVLSIRVARFQESAVPHNGL